MEKTLRRIIFVFAALSFFVPLLVLPRSFIFPFIVPKILLLRTISLAMLGTYILLVIGNTKKYLPRGSYIHWAVIFFGASYAISTFIGVDWYRSFWDNHERMLGLFTIMHYIFYYIVLSQVVEGEKEWRMLLRTFLAFGTTVMFIGFIQKYINSEFMLNRGFKRVSSTLGNAIYYSAYGMFLFFLGGLLAIREEARRWKIFAGFAALLGFFAIFWGGTRGTFLGVLAGIGLLALLYIFTLRGNKELSWIRYASIGTIAIAVVVLGVLFAYRDTSFVRQIPAIGRLVNMDISTGSAGTRIMAWGVALDAWKENPVLGWGPNNYYYAFNKYYRPEFLQHGWGETWFDNAHSVLMNTLATRGSVGVLSYIGLFLAAITSLSTAYKRDRIDMHTHNILLAFLLGHFVHNIFVFENPTSYLYFFFVLAYVASMTMAKERNSGEKTKLISTPTYVLVGLVVLLLVFVTNINPAKANTRTLTAIRSFSTGMDNALLAYEAASTTPSPHIDDIRNDIARTIREVVSSYIQAGRIEQADAYLTLAYDELGKNMQLHPMDIRVSLQRSGIAQIMAQVRQDPKYLLEAETMLEEALALSPKRQQLQFQLATVKMQVGKAEEAVALHQAAIENDPTIGESWWRFASLLDNYGNHEQALQIIEAAEEQEVVFKKQGRDIIAQIRANTAE